MRICGLRLSQPLAAWLLPALLLVGSAQASAQILNVQEFLDTCPANDPATTIIRQDFVLRTDAWQIIGGIPCTEPVSAMTPADIRAELIVLQVLRVAYHMDRGRSGHLPWTGGSLYDWMRTSIGGIQVWTSSGTFGGGTCCFWLSDQREYVQLQLKATDAQRAYFVSSPGFVTVLALLAHETRHANDYFHVACPGGVFACDQDYDEANLGANGVQWWLTHALLTGAINIGFDCADPEISQEGLLTLLNVRRSLYVGARPPFTEEQPDPGGPCGPPTPLSVTPEGDSGMQQVFSLQYYDESGGANITAARVQFGLNPLIVTGTCTVRYNAATATVSLRNDDGTAWLSAAFGAGTLQNGQCALDLATSRADVSAANLTLTLDLTFKDSFGGPRTIYMSAGNVTTNSGWLRRGTWRVPATIQTISVTPAAGSGSVSTFTLEYSDLLGANDLLSARVRFGASNDGAGSCTIKYDLAPGTFSLMNNQGTGWKTAPAGAETLKNAQCAVRLTASSAVLTGNRLTLILSVWFHPSFAGAKNVFMLARSAGGANTGWVWRGTWSVSIVEAISMTPSIVQNFSNTIPFRYSNGYGIEDFASVRVRFAANAPVSADTCTVRYDPVATVVALMNDAGTDWISGMMGTGSLENSQCRINLAGSSAAADGAELLLNLAITFKSGGLTSPSRVYMRAKSASGADTGWVGRGAWAPFFP